MRISPIFSLYLATNAPIIEVTITMHAMVPETASEAYRAAITIENSPLPIVFAHISIPEREALMDVFSNSNTRKVFREDCDKAD